MPNFLKSLTTSTVFLCLSVNVLYLKRVLGLWPEEGYESSVLGVTTHAYTNTYTQCLSLSNLLSPPNWSIVIGFHNISWRVIFLVEKCWPTWRSYWDAKASFFEGRAVWLLARTRAPTKPRSIGFCNNQCRDALWDPDTWRPHEECTSASCQVSNESKFHNHPPTNFLKNSWWLLYGNVGVFAPIAIISLQKLLLPWFNILISNKDVISEGWATSPSTRPSNLDHVSGGRTFWNWPTMACSMVLMSGRLWFQSR